MSLQSGLQNIWSSDYVQKNPNKAYKASYANEYAAVSAYLAGGTEPNFSGYSKLGKGLCEVEKERRGVVVVPPDPVPPDPPPPSGVQNFPRTYQINRLVGMETLWKYDWVVGFEFQNVQGYHAANPNGIAMTYVRLDHPAYNQSQFYPPSSGGPDAWTCSNIGFAFQSISNDLFPGEQEKYAVANWKGGTDNLSDGAAGNVGFMRAWTAADTKQFENCSPNEKTITFNLTNAGDLVGKLMVYAAKVCKLYTNGWNGVWSDNAFSQFEYAWSDGLNTVAKTLRDNLPGMNVGGNGAWIESYRTNGYPSNDPQGYLKYHNVNLLEGFDNHWGSINQTNVDNFIAWYVKCLGFADPYGQPRYCAFWDWQSSPDTSLRRMRWGLTLAMMPGMHYEPPNRDGWYDEYWGGSLNKRGYLGQPQASAQKLAGGVWRRDFDHGIVLNNSTGSSQTVNLNGTFRRLTGTQDQAVNSGATVTSVSIPHADGIILVR